jgi:phenylacetate-CoA ligase
MLTIENILRIRKYPIDKAISEIFEIQKFSKEEFYSWQEKKKWEIVKFHHRNNPLYKELVGKYLPENWEDLPIIKKSDLQNNLGSLISNGLSKRDLHFGSTSGSSGNPLKFAKDKYSHSITWAIILDRYKKIGITSSDYQARFFGIPLDGVPYYKERLKDFFISRYRFMIFDISESALFHFVDKFRTTPFKYLYGYTNSQLAFANFLKSKGIKLKSLCPTLKCSIVTSEQCSEENRVFLEDVFGFPIFNEYGAAEVGFLAMSDLDQVKRLSNESIFSEVLDDFDNVVPDGNTGRLIFTNFFNIAMPFIRYEVGDLGAIRKEEFSIQDQLIDIQGRLNDKVYLPSGKVAVGLALYYVSKYLMTAIGFIKEYQVHQLSLNKFLFLVVMDKELDEMVIKTIKKGLDIYLEKGLEVEVRKVEFIDREKSGKLKSFVSHLDMENKVNPVN